MKKNLSTLIHFFMCTSVMAGVLFSCRNNSPDDKAKGFPQSTAQNNIADKPANGNNVNFVPAAKAVTPGVVHIKTLYQNNSGNFSRFGNDNSPSKGGSGSGVVINTHGYIATNNHVVENATQIEVVFTDRRAFTAKLVGRDPNTDLALLKVDAKNLSIVELVNGKTVVSTADINEALMAAQNSRVQILGIAPDGSRIAFNFSLGA